MEELRRLMSDVLGSLSFMEFSTDESYLVNHD